MVPGEDNALDIRAELAAEGKLTTATPAKVLSRGTQYLDALTPSVNSTTAAFLDVVSIVTHDE